MQVIFGSLSDRRDKCEWGNKIKKTARRETKNRIDGHSVRVQYKKQTQWAYESILPQNYKNKIIWPCQAQLVAWQDALQDKWQYS